MSTNEERRARLVRIWPLFGLHVHTPRLELRYPDDDDLAELADLAAAGVHDPATMPFNHPWTDVAPPQQQRNTLLHNWQVRGAWTPDDWHGALMVVVDGRIVGTQSLLATRFAVLREVSSGSWLGRGAHGRGLGTEMRAAVLHLAFAGLGAERARSAAFEDNAASQRVSAKLGYVANGRKTRVRRGEGAWSIDLVLERTTWEATRRDDIVIEGLEPCLELFGATPGVSASTSR